VVDGIQSESLRLFCPDLADAFEGRQSPKALQAPSEVIGGEECRQVSAKALVSRVVEAPNGRIFDCAVHAFHLAVGPWMIEFRETVLDPVLRTGQVKRVGTEGLMSGEHRPNLGDAPAAVRRREVKPIVGEHGVDVVGQAFDEPA